MKKFFALTLLAALVLGLSLPATVKTQAIWNEHEPMVITNAL
ncbi:hypothetical protein [Tumebacillus amylolyticus]|nr:hypothetical protein [Tumebacillus amylolyticus]